LEIFSFWLITPTGGGADGIFDDGSDCGNGVGVGVGAGPLALPASSNFISSTILNTIFDLEGLLCLITGGRVGGAEGIFDDDSVCGVGVGPLVLPASSTPTTSSSTGTLGTVS